MIQGYYYGKPMKIEEFEKKYHIKGIYLNEKLVSDLKMIYPGHFKAFKEKKQ